MTYIPSTHVVRNEYADFREGPAADEFDRWLKTVKAEAWDEGFYVGNHESLYFKEWNPNPDRAED